MAARVQAGLEVLVIQKPTRGAPSGVVGAVLALPWWAALLVASAVYCFFALWAAHPSLGAPPPRLAPVYEVVGLGLAVVLLLPTAARLLRRRLDELDETDRPPTDAVEPDQADDEALGEEVVEGLLRRGFRWAETAAEGELVLVRAGQRFVLAILPDFPRPVPGEVVQAALESALDRGVDGVIVVTRGRFSIEAWRFCAGKSIQLYDGERLAELQLGDGALGH